MSTRTFLLWIAIGLATCALLVFCGCATTPVMASIPNFHVIDLGPNLLGAWRGAEPDVSGCKMLHNLGVTKVVKLNTEAESTDANLRGYGMQIVECPITTEQQLFGGKELEFQVQKAVGSIGPNTFVHCGSDVRTKSPWDAHRKTQGGQDRTGLVCAVYRVRVQHWSKADAEKEMLANGFHKELRGLWEYWENWNP